MRAETERLSRRLNELRLELAEDKSEETQKAVSALYVQIEALHRRQLVKEHEITKQLAQIEDAQVRTSIQLHYIDGYTWNDVADILGGNNTEDSCKKYVSRYFKKLSYKSQ
jgi:DNA-directed RNA polymerase specialized sigma24 family protein